MPVFKTQEALAQHYGLTATAVRKWEKHPAFPCRAGSYDTDLIDRWRSLHMERERENKAGGTQADQLAIALKAVKLQREQLALEEQQEERKRRRGDILSRSECETSMAEAVTIARDQLLTLPHRLARMVARKLQPKFVAEAETVIRKVLEDLATMLEAVGQPEEDGK